MTCYRIRVESTNCGWIAYVGISYEAASLALRRQMLKSGERAVSEYRVGERWVKLVAIEGGHTVPCPRCDGDVECWVCHGRGVL
jgi:hypothetical protein